MEERKTHLEMAVELDEMERGVPTKEADLLERVLPLLRKGKKPDPKDLVALERMHEKYFGESREDEPEEPDEEEDPDL